MESQNKKTEMQPELTGDLGLVHPSPPSHSFSTIPHKGQGQVLQTDWCCVKRNVKFLNNDPYQD